MKNKTIYNLQIARGIATVLVVLAHSTMFLGESRFYGIFAIGRCSVDFFFIISGFIIYYTSSSSINNFSQLKQYLLQRVARVYPVHFISLTLILLVCYFLVYINAYNYTFDGILILKSFVLWPAFLGHLHVNPVTWTLSYEVFFYLLFGVSIFIGKHFSLFFFLFWSFVILMTLRIDNKNTFYYFITNTKNIEFTYGYLIAMYVNKINFNKRFNLFLFLLGILLLILSWQFIWERKFIEDAKFDFIFSGIPSVLIVYSLVKLEKNSSSKLKSIFVFVGNASYSIYLNHFTLMFFLNYYFDKFITNKVLMFLFINSISISFGLIFYVLIEKPISAYFRKSINRYFALKNRGLSEINEGKAQPEPIFIKS